MRGLTSCVIGIILATGCWLIFQNGIKPLFQNRTDIRSLIIAVVLSLIWFGFKGKWKKLSPIVLILLSAALGILVYSV
jgi:chromate transporter